MSEVLPLNGNRKPLFVLFCVPCHDNVPSLFAYDLAHCYGKTVLELVARGHRVGFLAVSGTLVHSARQELLEKCIEEEATHVVWLDSDMRFPPEAVLRLLDHNVPFVGINYAKRRLPPRYVAMKREGVPLETTEDSTGLEEVEAVGFGLFVMRTSALKHLSAGKPWFWFERDELNRLVGEDVYFCRLIREGGHKILIDHDLSKECRHIGTHEYALENIWAWERTEVLA